MDVSVYCEVREPRTETQRKGFFSQLKESRFLRFALLTLGVLCVLQAVLNVSLRLSNQDPELSVTEIQELCANVSCSRCSTPFRKLLQEYCTLQTERDQLLAVLQPATSESTPLESATSDSDYIYEYSSTSESTFVEGAVTDYMYDYSSEY